MPEIPQSEIAATIFFRRARSRAKNCAKFWANFWAKFSCFARCAELRKKLLPKFPAIYHSVSCEWNVKISSPWASGVGGCWCFCLFSREKGGQFVQTVPKLFAQTVFLFGWVVFLGGSPLDELSAIRAPSLAHKDKSHKAPKIRCAILSLIFVNKNCFFFLGLWPPPNRLKSPEMLSPWLCRADLGWIFYFGLANLRKIAGEVLSKFWWRNVFRKSFSLLFPGLQAPQ